MLATDVFLSINLTYWTYIGKSSDKSDKLDLLTIFWTRIEQIKLIFFMNANYRKLTVNWRKIFEGKCLGVFY